MPSLGMPHQAEVEAALLALLAERHRPISASEAYLALGRKFDLTSELRNRLLTTAPRSEWENIVRQAKRRLVDNGLVVKSKEDRWQLTALGKASLGL